MLPSASSAGLATGCRFSATVTAMLTGAEFEELPLVAMVSSPEVASSGTRVMTKSSELTTIGASTSPKSTRGWASCGGFPAGPRPTAPPPGGGPLADLAPGRGRARHYRFDVRLPVHVLLAQQVGDAHE